MFKEEKKFRQLIEKYDIPEKKKIFLALKLIKKYHKKQKREEGIPYFIHCVRTANLLIEKEGVKNWETILGALLHDIVEDTAFKNSQIKKLFGKRVAEIVSALTRKRPKREKEEEKYKNKSKYFSILMKKDKEVRMIKAFDCLDNMMSWKKIAEKEGMKIKIKRWFKEAKNLYLPLARSVDKKIFFLMKRFYEKNKKEIKL